MSQAALIHWHRTSNYKLLRWQPGGHSLNRKFNIAQSLLVMFILSREGSNSENHSSTLKSQNASGVMLNTALFNHNSLQLTIQQQRGNSNIQSTLYIFYISTVITGVYVSLPGERDSRFQRAHYTPSSLCMWNMNHFNSTVFDSHWCEWWFTGTWTNFEHAIRHVIITVILQLSYLTSHVTDKSGFV